MCRSLWRGKAAGDEVRPSRRLHHGRLRIFLLALPAGIGVVPVLHNHCFGRDQFQTPTYFLANFGHGTPALRADQFLLRKTVFHHLHRYVFRQFVQRVFMFLVPLVGGNGHTAVILFCGLVCIDLRLVKQQAQLLHGILRSPFRGRAKPLLPAQTDRFCQQCHLLFKGKNPLFLPLKFLIFCTGNGHHFLSVCQLFRKCQISVHQKTRCQESPWQRGKNNYGLQETGAFQGSRDRTTSG